MTRTISSSLLFMLGAITLRLDIKEHLRHIIRVIHNVVTYMFKNGNEIEFVFNPYKQQSRVY